MWTPKILPRWIVVFVRHPDGRARTKSASSSIASSCLRAHPGGFLSRVCRAPRVLRDVPGERDRHGIVDEIFREAASEDGTLVDSDASLAPVRDCGRRGAFPRSSR